MACIHLRLFYVLLFITGALKAQLREFTIAEMPRPEVAVVQANIQFPDDALLLVYSDIEGLEFRSSLDKLDKQTYNAAASRYEIFVKPNKQLIFVAKSGYIEVKLITLNPSPKDVFYFKVEEKLQAPLEDSKPGKLSINSEPPGADIYLNGYKVADKTPFIFELNSGTTKIKLKKKKYEDFDTTVVIQSSKTNTLNAKLNSSFLFLNITSNPAGASVRIDGIELGKTPFSKEIDLSDKLLRGIKTMQLEANGYEIISEQMVFTPSTTPLERNYLLNKLKASFTINSTPAGASVYIDGMYKGITPYTGSRELGTLEVKVELDGYMPSEKKQLQLSQNANNQAAFTLRPLPKPDEEAEITSQDIKEVRIGNQIWMAENLNTDRFRNGEMIPQAQSAEEWKLAGANKKAAWCYYDNDPTNGEKYGKLYNWYSVADARGLCPVGWHVPSDREWIALTDHLGGNEIAGSKMKYSSEWNENGNGNNNSGFSGLPGGLRYYDGTFYLIGKYGTWWSSTENDTEDARGHSLSYDGGYVYRYYDDKERGFSVRCLRD